MPDASDFFGAIRWETPQAPGPKPVQAEHISRGDFLAMFGRDYKPGQHVTFLGPTQRGKTTLAFQCLKVVISPTHKCLVLASKPPKRDHTMTEVPKKLNLRVIHEWPPEYEFGDKKRNGWVLQPVQKMRNADEDNAALQREFGKAIMGAYRDADSDLPLITVADEANLVHGDLKLQKEANQALQRGAPHNAMWTIAQRGRYLSYHVYDAAEHIFLFYDPDMANQMRYAEFGGADRREMIRLTSELRTKEIANGRTISECLYIRRAGPKFYIIGTD